MVQKIKYRNLLQCIHCGAENPPTAYCCLSCFKVLKATPKVSFWKIRIQPTVPGIVVVLLLFVGIAVMLKHWMENIDAQVTMDLKTVDYTLSFIADKRKKKILPIIEEKNASAPSESPAEPVNP